jgi:predicted hydrocarbon binding protein
MLYIIIEEHSGILLNIYRCLSKAKYEVISNKFGKIANNGKSYIKLEIDKGKLPLSPKLEGEILNIKGCTDILYDEPLNVDAPSQTTSNNTSNSEKLQKEIRITCKAIVDDFSNIETIVHSFSQRFQSINGTNHIYSLGFAAGSTIYELEYALGKPLKLEAALKRMLSDAIKTFGRVRCSQHIISIEQNIFCNIANPNSHCDFTKGFMTGFLHSSPKTKDVRVENISCRCQGRNSCSFEFH